MPSSLQDFFTPISHSIESRFNLLGVMRDGVVLDQPKPDRCSRIWNVSTPSKNALSMMAYSKSESAQNLNQHTFQKKAILPRLLDSARDEQ